jgi:GntR family transcriptional repressor for pyruvate dehydrogenase complex
METFAPEPLPPRASSVDACADALRRAILGGELVPGSRLPPERELATRFGVNRVTVRTALARLATEGLLRARQGSGHTVRDFRSDAGPLLLPGIADLARTEGQLADVVRDLLHVRRSLARGVLERLAARPPSAKARAALAAAIDDMEQAALAGAPAQAFAAHDVAILAALLDATGSSVLRLCLNPVVSVLAGIPELAPALYGEPRSNVAAYRLLLLWLEAPDAHGLEAFSAELARRDAHTVRLLEPRRLPSTPRRVAHPRKHP